jgi:hypothetical protein
MAMSKKDHALRETAKYLLSRYYKCKKDSPLADELKLFADLCCIALPNKYRFTRKELHELGLPGED